MTAARARVAGVLVHDVQVGTLSLEHGSRTTFRFDEAYLDAPDRPVLGRWFEEHLSLEATLVGTQSRVPDWFGHVLPDATSHVRSLLAAHAGVKPHHELELLLALADDLPGALHVRPASAEGEPVPDDSPPAERAVPATDGRLRFSLAGMQLKVSARAEGQRLTVPVRGEESRYLVKLPDPRYADLPRIEAAVLTWARHAGIDVPDHRLVEIATIDGIPSAWASPERLALSIDRYDRGPAGRSHQEDFAQVFGVKSHDPEAKYVGSLDRIARVVQAVCPQDFDELLRRFAFVVLSGNADAHLKNWSLVYPDRRKPRLSPAYDLVFTLFAPGAADTLGLKLRRKRAFGGIVREDFEALAESVGVPAERARIVVGEFVARARATFEAVRELFPGDVAPLLEEHLGRIQL